MADFPGYYDPDRIGTLFYPDMGAIAAAAARAALPPAAGDLQNVHLVIIDMQVDFCHTRGSLNVPGALGDIRRLVEFIFRYAAQITNITCSLDSHLPFQIFHPAWWSDAAGEHPQPFTIISYDDIRAGNWRPLVDPVASTAYVRKLEQQAKKQLTIWPYHVGIGSVGYALDPELWSAILWHSLARKSQPTWLTKGSVPQTEHYSIIQPEIPVPGHPLGGTNKPFLDTLEEADAIVIAGEAESHCVLETVEDLVEAFGDRPALLEKIFFLRDCTSPVVHPDVDFHAIASAQLDAFARQGINLVNSTEPLPFLAAIGGVS
jgi:nicotinamidase-related amidase